MKTGIITGLIISFFLLTGCYYLLGAGADMCNPGYGFLLSPAILITAIAISVFLVNKKSAFIAYSARTIIISVTLSLLTYFFVFFM